MRLSILIFLVVVFELSAPVLPLNWYDSSAVDTLNNGLISYWKLDEASGYRFDSEPTGTPQDLTDANTVTTATGIINDGAFFTAANDEFLYCSDSADLSSIRMVTAWVKMTTRSGNMVISSHWSLTPSDQRAWRLWFNSGAGKFGFEVAVSSTQTEVSATVFGTPSTNVLYFVAGWIDTVNNKIGISVNNGTPNTLTYSSGIRDSTAVFDIGARGLFADTWDGLIDEVGAWSRVLTPTELTRLYNAGAGMTCCPF